MYINPFMSPICPGVILSELSSSFRSNSLGVFDKQFRDCFRCVFSIAIRFSLVPYTKPINIKKRKGIRLSASEGVQALYTQTGDTPRISRGAFICFSVYNAILDFSLAQKSAKRFFLQYVKHGRFTTAQNNNFPIKMFPI